MSLEKKLVNVHELNKVTTGIWRSRCLTDQSVNLLDVRREVEELYKAVKLYGFDNIETVHFDECMYPYMRVGKDISEDIRVLSAFGVMNLLLMSDSAVSVDRLQVHYGDVFLKELFESRSGMPFKLTDDSLVDAMERYTGASLNRNSYEPIYIQQLYNFVMRKTKRVDLLELWSQTEALYKGIVTLGLENVRVWFYENHSERKEMFGSQLLAEIRAFCGLIVMFMYGVRIDSTHVLHIRNMLGLRYSIHDYLGYNYLAGCKTLQQIVSLYVEAPAGTIEAKPLFIQKPFELIEMKNFDFENLRNIELLWTALDSLYRNVKMVGLPNVSVSYFDEIKKQKVVLTGTEIPERVRAFCEECVIYMYRMSDDSVKRAQLEEIFCLDNPSSYLLGDTNVISCKKSMPCVSLKEIAKRYMES